MLKKDELKRLAPLALFFSLYTLAFIVWAGTFWYTLPFLLGLLIAAALQPPIRLAKRRLGWSHGLACGIITFLALALLFVGLAFLASFAVREITGFLVKAAQGGFPEFSPVVQRIFAQIKTFFQNLNTDFFQRNQQELMDLLKNSMDLATALLSGLLGLLTSLPALVTLVLTASLSAFFIARDFIPLQRWAKGLLTTGAVRQLKLAAKSSAGTGRRTMLSYALIYFISFCEAFVILSVLNAPYPLITALAACIADVLPVLGPGIVFAPVAIYQLFTGAYGRSAGILVGWLVMTCIRQVIEPRLVSSSTKIHPLVMVAALYFSLVAGSLWVLVYVVGFFMLYSVFRDTGLLPPLVHPTKP